MPRWYCRQAHETFSLLADCLAARLPGTLVEVEQVVVAVEQASSLAVAVAERRPEVELPGVLRWTRRRVQGVHAALSALRGVMPERFGTVTATVSAFAETLALAPVLPALRAIAADYLAHLPTPLGFHHRGGGGGEVTGVVQQPTGPDPPAAHR